MILHSGVVGVSPGIAHPVFTCAVGVLATSTMHKMLSVIDTTQCVWVNTRGC